MTAIQSQSLAAYLLPSASQRTEFSSKTTKSVQSIAPSDAAAARQTPAQFAEEKLTTLEKTMQTYNQIHNILDPTRNRRPQTGDAKATQEMREIIERIKTDLTVEIDRTSNELQASMKVDGQLLQFDSRRGYSFGKFTLSFDGKPLNMGFNLAFDPQRAATAKTQVEQYTRDGLPELSNRGLGHLPRLTDIQT